MIIYGKNWKNENIELDVPHDHLFLGTCEGIALVPRSKTDNHICFIILTEDDGYWYFGTNSYSTSSFWLDDLQIEIGKAKKWMEQNAEKEQYGYKFKE